MQNVVPVAATHLQRSFRFFEFCQACWKPWEWSTRVLWCTCEGTKLLLRGTALSVFIVWCGTDSVPTFYHTILKMVRLSPGWARNFSIWSGYWLLCQTKLTWKQRPGSCEVPESCFLSHRWSLIHFDVDPVTLQAVQVAGLRQRYDAIGACRGLQNSTQGGGSSGSQFQAETSCESVQHLATFLYPHKERCKAEDEVRVLSAQVICQQFRSLK